MAKKQTDSGDLENTVFLKIQDDFHYIENLSKYTLHSQDRFSKKESCENYRRYKALDLEENEAAGSNLSSWIKDAITGIMTGKRCLEGVETELPNVMNDDYPTEETKRQTVMRMYQCISRYVTSEKRSLSFSNRKKYLVWDNQIIVIRPDAVFIDAKKKEIEAIIYRAGKPTVKTRGENAAKDDIRLQLNLKWIKTLVPDGEKYKVMASYYFLRKDSDGKEGIIDGDFFEHDKKNVVSISDSYTGGSDAGSVNDQHLSELLKSFFNGHGKEDKACEYCELKDACSYKVMAAPFIPKERNVQAVRQYSKSQQQLIDIRDGIYKVSASAGSGKTECITERAIRMFLEGEDPDSFLFLSFTNSGVDEMRERIIKKVSSAGLMINPSKLHCMTFHTFCYEYVKGYHKLLGFSKEPVVIDHKQKMKIIEKILDDHVISGLNYLNFSMDTPYVKGAAICAEAVFETVKELRLNPAHLSESDMNLLKDKLSQKKILSFVEDVLPEILNSVSSYYNMLCESSFISYDDMESLFIQILIKKPDLVHRMHYRHIIVDEAQDSSDKEMTILKKMLDGRWFRSLLMVGDGRQDVYSFRGSMRDCFTNPGKYLGTPVTELCLNENRRSSGNVVSLSNQLELKNYPVFSPEFFKAKRQSAISVKDAGSSIKLETFQKKEDEYNFIADRISALIGSGVKPESIVFIAYKRTELEIMGKILNERNILYTMKNPIPFKENSNICAALNLFKALDHPEEERYYYLYLYILYKGRILELLSKTEIKEEIRIMREELTAAVSSGDEDELRQILHSCLDALNEEDEIFDAFLKNLYACESLPDEISWIKAFERYGSTECIRPQKDYPGVTLITAHSSKGMEWENVFLSLSNFYDQETSEKQEHLFERRRLVYIGITRAKDDLVITGQEYAFGSKAKGTKVKNIFLEEIREYLEGAKEKYPGIISVGIQYMILTNKLLGC